MPEIIRWPADSPLPARELTLLKDCISMGRVIVYPTSTLYGLGAGIGSNEGITLVNDIKSRPAGMPLSIMASRSQAEALCIIPEIAREFLDSGDISLTAILPAREIAPGRLVHNGTLAVRLPCSPLTASLVNFIGPITATSANVHGTPTPTEVCGIMEQLGGRVSFYIDSGMLDGKPTSIVDYTGERPKVIRNGAISGSEGGKTHGR